MTVIEEGNSDEKDEEETFVRRFQEWTTKDILKEISLYFNPGSIIGIMGPSGCGKTTLLDILTGRNTGNFTVRGYYMFTIILKVVGSLSLHRVIFT